MELANVGGDAFYPLGEHGVGVGVERSHGAGEGHLVGNDIRGAATGNFADGDDGGVERIDGTADSLLELGDDLGRNPNGIYSFVGACAVARFAGDRDFKIVGGSGEGALAQTDDACGNGGKGVDAKDGGDVFHDAIFDHPPCALGGFFGGLEEEAGGAGEGGVVGLGEFGEDHGGAEADGGVGIVAAGVHDAGAFGGEGEVCFFGDGQSVHVGADGEDVAVGFGFAGEFGDDAGFADHFLNVEAAGGKDAGDVGGGFVFLAAEFGMGVNVAADFDEARGELCGDFLDGGEHVESVL